MLIAALVLAVISLAALVSAVVTSNEVIAWACIGFSALGVLLLIVDAIRDRNRRAAPVPENAANTELIPAIKPADAGTDFSYDIDMGDASTSVFSAVDYGDADAIDYPAADDDHTAVVVYSDEVSDSEAAVAEAGEAAVPTEYLSVDQFVVESAESTSAAESYVPPAYTMTYADVPPAQPYMGESSAQTEASAGDADIESSTASTLIDHAEESTHQQS